MKFWTTIKEAKVAAIEEARYQEDSTGIARANLRSGDSVVVSAKIGPSGKPRCTVRRVPGHYTTERPTGGLADQIRDARRDVYGR